MHKTVETQHVHENVQVRHEEVDVERRPISDPLARPGADHRTEDEIRIPLHAEEVVVEKRVVPTEELVVRKREVVENEGVDTTLRREHAEVEREITDGRTCAATVWTTTAWTAADGAGRPDRDGDGRSLPSRNSRGERPGV